MNSGFQFYAYHFSVSCIWSRWLLSLCVGIRSANWESSTISISYLNHVWLQFLQPIHQWTAWLGNVTRYVSTPSILAHPISWAHKLPRSQPLSPSSRATWQSKATNPAQERSVLSWKRPWSRTSCHLAFSTTPTILIQTRSPICQLPLPR